MEINLEVIKRTKDSPWEVVTIIDAGKLVIDSKGDLITEQIYDGYTNYISPVKLDITEIINSQQKLIDVLKNYPNKTITNLRRG